MRRERVQMLMPNDPEQGVDQRVIVAEHRRTACGTSRSWNRLPRQSAFFTS
jgi:hypothetical protein